MNQVIHLAFIFLCLSFSKQVIAEDININRCDSLFCPTGGADNSGANAALREEVGIIVQPASASNYPQVRRRTRGTIDNTTVENPTALAPRAQTQRVGNGTGAGSSEVNNDQNTDVEKSSVPAQQQPQHEPSSSQSGGSVSQFNSPSGANNNSQLKAGLLYSNEDEEPDSSSKTMDLSNKAGSALANIAPTMDPVKQNLKNSSTSDSAGAAYSPTGTRASDFGTYQSGTPAANQGVIAQLKDGFAEIANSLGDKFFGGLGSSGARGKKGSLNSNSALAKNTKLNRDKASDINARDLLKRGLAQFNGRGLANHLEFGASNTSLFGNMCEHYVNYALRNSIPNDRSPCPLK